MYVSLNGTIRPLQEAWISPLDRGFLLGDGIFETLAAYRGRPFLLERHVERLKKSAGLLGIHPPFELSKVSADVEELISLNNLIDKQAYIRLTLTRGPVEGRLIFEEAEEPTFLIIAREYERYPDSFYESGVAVITSSTVRSSSNPVHAIKSISYLENIFIRQAAAESDSFEALIFNEEGQLAEGAFTNVFVVLEGELITPDDSCNLLAGVTRDFVLELCARVNIPARKGILTSEEVLSAQEIFLTNSLIGVMPVRRLDGRQIGEEIPGAITAKVIRFYEKESGSGGDARP